MLNVSFRKTDALKAATFFIGLGVAIGKGSFLYVAALLALIICIVKKETPYNLKNKWFRETTLLFCFYVGIVTLISLLQGDTHSAKMVIRSFDKITAFFIIYLLLGKLNNWFYFCSLGFILGVLFVESTVFYSFVYKTSNFGNRLTGMYGHPNSLGAVMELVIPFLFYFLYKYRDTYFKRVVTSIVLICSLLCLFGSGSRGALLAVIGESCIFVGIYIFRRFKIKSLKIYCAIVIILGVACLLGFIYFFPRGYDKERILLWSSTLKMFLDHPVLGVGFSNWEEMYRPFYISPLAKEPDLPHCHNLYLHLLSTTGIVGTIAYFALAFGQLRMAVLNSIKEYRKFGDMLNISDMYIAAVCGMLIHNFVDINAIQRFYLMKLFFFWALCCLRFEELEHISN